MDTEFNVSCSDVYNKQYEEYSKEQLNYLNNEIVFLRHKKDKAYNIYDTLIVNNKIIQNKINTYKNVICCKKKRNNATHTFISLNTMHMNTLMNNQIDTYNNNFNKIDNIVDTIDHIDTLIDQIKFKILFI